MPRRLLSTAVIAAAILSASPAFADGFSTSSYDDVSYPAHDASFGAVLDGEPIVISDVTYAGPHTAFAEPLAARSGGVLAYDDVVFPVVDEVVPTVVPAAPVRAPEQRPACDCGRR
jgi:hypothetical protein